MPTKITNNTSYGGVGYANPFVGAPGPVTNLTVNSALLTNRQIDANGLLIPGTPLTASGAPIGVTAAGTAVAAAVAGNTGNGAMGAVTVGAGAKAGVYRLTIIEPGANVGTFQVEDPDGVGIGTGVVASAFNKGGLSFTLADGATDFVAGDAFTITVTLTAGDSSVAYGVTFEPIEVFADNASGTLAAGGTIMVAVATSGLINRDVAEDNIGASYSAAEIAALVAGNFKLTN